MTTLIARADVRSLPLPSESVDVAVQLRLLEPYADALDWARMDGTPE